MPPKKIVMYRQPFVRIGTDRDRQRGIGSWIPCRISWSRCVSSSFRGWNKHVVIFHKSEILHFYDFLKLPTVVAHQEHLMGKSTRSISLNNSVWLITDMDIVTSGYGTARIYANATNHHFYRTCFRSYLSSILDHAAVYVDLFIHSYSFPSCRRNTTYALVVVTPSLSSDSASIGFSSLIKAVLKNHHIKVIKYSKSV